MRTLTSSVIGALALVAMLFSLYATAQASIREHEFETEAQRQLYQTLTQELRCPKCQNQNIADSDAGLAKDLRNEVAKMVKQGMTSVEAIQAATIHAADVMGWGNQVGQINPGFFADIVALRDNPISNIQALEKIDVVIKGGQLYKLEGKLFN